MNTMQHRCNTDQFNSNMKSNNIIMHPVPTSSGQMQYSKVADQLSAIQEKTKLQN